MVVCLALLEMAPLETVELQTEYLDYFTRKEDHASDMVFIKQNGRSGVNLESPARIQPGKNISEGSNPRRTYFTREQNDLFI